MRSSSLPRGVGGRFAHSCGDEDFYCREVYPVGGFGEGFWGCLHGDFLPVAYVYAGF
ncbi:hypothetical protein CFL01nite_12170 [Corynebacterium flavescens]|uniref:Uncharacterized protein n=1 Tax=Corynebacterium flavescens TaxID=28028 RepID=A0AB73B8F8_CORFL|nr:hypothetical protein CFL01nite_12170 [Corynebacterium flavescens]